MNSFQTENKNDKKTVILTTVHTHTHTGSLTKLFSSIEETIQYLAYKKSLKIKFVKLKEINKLKAILKCENMGNVLPLCFLAL